MTDQEKILTLRNAAAYALRAMPAHNSACGIVLKGECDCDQKSVRLWLQQALKQTD